ncbi:MAG: hypothetical protein VKJ31_04210 [Synechococcus sp.]|nr:hypothetical protein [Synechococcus sp.]
MRTPLISLGLLSLLCCLTTPSPAKADSTKAWCSLFEANDQNNSLPEPVPCRFSQSQGNATVVMPQRRFDFPAKEQGKTYQRDNSTAGIGFSRKGDFTLVVFWQDPRKQ